METVKRIFFTDIHHEYDVTMQGFSHSLFLTTEPAEPPPPGFVRIPIEIELPIDIRNAGEDIIRGHIRTAAGAEAAISEALAGAGKEVSAVLEKLRGVLLGPPDEETPP